MKRNVAFIHTSPAAIPPLADYFRANAPELEITNLLDDGILRFFSRGMEREAESRLSDMLCAARDAYHSELAMVTCSAVSRNLVLRLSDSMGIPIVKIDDALAVKAVAAGKRLGILVTFPPTQAVTSKLILDTAAESGCNVDLTFRVIPEAYEAILGGRPELHDQLLLAAIEEFGRQKLDAIVLAQVSMARLLTKLPPLPMPVLSSLTASLTTIREGLAKLSVPVIHPK
ncbi:MAG: hypothetical protein HYZ37_14875 [Candidatus Solibacter usitatus]|nr:hypothetical protein [Candidatus Solibacter usitatus]